MASIRKRGRTWRAEVWVQGVRESGTFHTRAEAAAWADERERQIVAGEAGVVAGKTLADALERYAREESPKHRGERWERLRLAKMARDFGDAARRPLREFAPEDVARWRNRRLAVVAPASVARELQLLRAVLAVAVREWRWLAENPAKAVRKPPPTPPRTRRVSEDEASRLTLALGFTGSPPANVSQRIAVAFLFAIETGMRLGEICALTWPHVHARHVHLPATKNGHARDVPLSRRARELLELLPLGDGAVFALAPATVDALFRRAKARAGVADLHFHDTRHEAATRLARKVDVLDLARILGHRDLKSLTVYYNPSVEELADRLG